MSETMCLDRGNSEGYGKIDNSEEKPSTVELQTLELGRDVDEDGDDDCKSEISLPIFWKSSSPKSPIESFSSHILIYPSSRAELIEQGRKQLMAMVQNLPETSYELSLRDIVELPLVSKSSKNGRIKESEVSDKIDKRKGKSKSFNKTNAGHDHINSGGLFLKMFFPVPASPKKKRSKSDGGSRILPSSPSFEGKVGLNGECCKNKSARAGDDKYRSRGNVNNRKNREKRGDGVMLPHPCWPFFRTCHCAAKRK